MRGEYRAPPGGENRKWELPPRARRIPTIAQVAGEALGTTSACAENTHILSKNFQLPWNYLRVRGEYAGDCDGEDSSGELPPRARRIRPTLGHLVLSLVNYLRVRGEYTASHG